MILITAPSRSVLPRTAVSLSDGCRRCYSTSQKSSGLHSFGFVSKGLKHRIFKASLITNPDDFAVGKYVGEYGFMNVTSYSSLQPGGPSDTRNIEVPNVGYSSEDIERLRIQDIGEGKVKIRLYEGRVVKGPLQGVRVIFKHPVLPHFLKRLMKVYPGRRAGGIEADMMAANELNCHASLQEDSKIVSENIQILLGGFETRTGEQWLAFRNDGIYSAADYAKVRSEGISKDIANTKQTIWPSLDGEGKFKRRRFFVIKLLNGAINGLAFMHDHDRLHQSIGPASVVLNTISEGEATYLVPRLRDLAFSVDIRYTSLEAGTGPLSEGLWRRAIGAGAYSPLEKRAFGIADDIYEAGLLFAYLAFVPFCEMGVMDGLSLRRLFETTFQLDLAAARE
ncbi:uncharacterized protein LOC110115170 isoform X1 [Dendrobium catenatum]|uniref:uncharacterized protein LOC110115170 isoform X1 n=1 Tax=Dendrobium catenatum TaxID=906689 RepID=UPI0009F494C3|nr:uncharacterized protein LOC110115170 isoform X1 [Dendrobium catenatum]